jgi:hypothetical protein
MSILKPEVFNAKYRKGRKMKRLVIILAVSFAILSCDTGTTSSEPVNPLVGTWRRETDTAIFEITFTDTEYIYKVTHSQESDGEDFTKAYKYISNSSLFSIYESDDNIFTWYYYIDGDMLLIGRSIGFEDDFYIYRRVH